MFWNCFMMRHWLLVLVAMCACQCKAFLFSEPKAHHTSCQKIAHNSVHTHQNGISPAHVLFAENDAENEADSKKEVKVDELLTSPAFLKKKIEVLKNSIEKKEGEIAELEAEAAKEWEEWGDQIQRVRNEMKNIRARSLNDTMEARTQATVKILKEAVVVADNFGRAQMSIKAETEEEEAVAKAYGDIFANMEKAFEELGMTAMTTVGEPFNPNYHEAVMSSPSEEYPEDSVCQEFQKGYILGETCIRPAMVVVSLGPGP